MAEGFGRRASGQGERNCAKDIGVAEVNRRLGNKPQERTMHRRIGWSANQWRAGQQNVNLRYNNCLDRSRVFACVCRINYDNQKTQSENTGVKFDGRLRVRRIVGDAARTNREEIGNLSEFSEVRRRDRRRFTEITEKAQLLVKVITSSGAC